jgi:hypothetical protein
MARIPDNGGLLWPRHEGFLTAEKDPFTPSTPTTVTCWRWFGTEAWSVALPTADISGGPQTAWRGRDLSLSPDGHILAVACAGGRRIRVITWRDGERIGECAISIPPQPARYQVAAVNDGRALLWQANTPTSPIFLINGAQYQRTVHRSALAAASAGYARVITQDGHRLIGYQPYASKDSYRLECANVELVDGRPAVLPYFTLKRLHHPFIFDGAIVDAHGASFRKRADMTAADQWTVLPDAGLFPDCAVQGNGSARRVVQPAEERNWCIPQVPSAWGIGISENGRFAVTYAAGATQLPRALTRFSNSPTLAEWTGILFAPRTIRLYTQPGRQLATMTLSGVQASIRQAYLSPDGKHLLLHAVNAR